MLFEIFKKRISWLRLYTSLSVFLFSAISLVVPSGYSYGAFLLVLGISFLVINRPSLDLQIHDFYFIGVLIFYFFVNIFSSLYHHLPMQSYDRSSRFLLAIPVYLLLIAYPPKRSFFWQGLMFGALSAGIFAIYQKYFLLVARPSGFTNAIQFGDISVLLFGLLLCFISAHNRYVTALLVGSVALGLFASFLSLSRGGWIAIPLILLIVYKSLNFDAGNKQRVLHLFTAVVLLVALCSIFLSDNNFLKVRLLKTYDEVASFVHGDLLLENTSITSRVVMWKNGIDAFTAHPILGWGDLIEVKKAYPSVWKQLDMEDNYKHLHNEYIDELAKRGVIGFIGLLALFLVPLRYFIISLKGSDSPSAIPFAAAGIVLIISVMIFGLTQTFMAHNSGATVFIFYLIIIKAYTRNIIQNVRTTPI